MALTIVTALFPITATAAELQYGDLYYVIENGNAIITDCNSDATSVDIPSKIDNYPVTSIGFEAFSYCSQLTSVNIPNSVTSIGESAFFSCRSLKSVTIPNSVTSIGVETFAHCTQLTSVNISNSVTSIGERAFWNCINLTSITIPNSVTSIGVETFLLCYRLISVHIPASVKYIHGSAFGGCTDLTITVDNNNKNYSSVDGILFSKDKTEIVAYIKNEPKYDIPDGVTSIGDGAFYYCNNLASVTIPNSVTNIGSGAFKACWGLRNITIPDSVTSIGDSAFQSSDLTSINIPQNVTYIGDNVFQSCEELTSVSLHNGITSIGNEVFAGCRALTSVAIPDSVTSIGENAFEFCENLTKINISHSVINIHGSAFNGCGNLIITVDGNNNYYSSIDGVLFNKNKTKIIAYAKDKICPNYTIPEGVTSIGDYAFSFCDYLVSLGIPDSVTSIGEKAFYWCGGINGIFTDVYYSGRETQWSQISVGEGNDWLLYANIHFADDNADVKIKDVIEEKSERKVSANFKNNTEETQTFEAICAVYDARGALITYENVTITVTSGETRDVTFFLSTSNWASYKLFAWDELGMSAP